VNAPFRARAPHSPPVAEVDPLKALIARAEARAMLWAAGELDLHDAVDELWAAAVRDGLVDQLGADAVQRLLADAFAPVRDDLQRDEDVVLEPIGEKDSLLEGLKTCADTKWHFEEWERRKTETESSGNAEDTFAQACRKADEKERGKPVDPRIERARRLLEDDVSLERAWRELNKPPNGIAPATLDAAEYLHDQGDFERFKRWFDRHSAAERAAIFRHLDGRKKGRGK
jgi:hypothetical protein